MGTPKEPTLTTTTAPVVAHVCSIGRVVASGSMRVRTNDGAAGEQAHEKREE